MRILRKNSSETNPLEENNSNFKRSLVDSGYAQTLRENLLSEIKFTERKSKLLKQNNKEEKENTAIRGIISTLSVYYKGSLNEKVESYTRLTIPLLNL